MAVTVMTHHQMLIERSLPSEAQVFRSALHPGSSQLNTTGVALHFVVEGIERYRIGRDAAPVSVSAGQFILTPSRSEARIEVPAGVAHGLCFYFNPRASADLQRAFGGAVVGTRAAANSIGLPADGTIGHDELKARADLICAALLREAEALVAEQHGAARNLGRKQPGKVDNIRLQLDRAHAFIRENRERIVSLQEVAKVAGMSPYHFARQFSQLYGRPPIDLHRDLMFARMVELREAGATLTQIAEIFGYNDISAASRAFTRHQGAGFSAWAANGRAHDTSYRRATADGGEARP